MTRKTPAVRIACSAAFLVLALALVPAALANKGHGGSGATSSATATLVSDCNPCALGAIAHFTGSGYNGAQPSAQIYLKSSDGTTTGGAIPVNSDGTVAFAWYMNPVGTYDVRIYQYGSGGKLVLKGELIVSVQ